MLLCGSCANLPAMKPDAPKPLAGAVRFTVFVPGAKQVFLVGSFNGWAKESTPMNSMDGSSLWSVDVPLTQGEYTFMYVIDGVQWMTPPHAEDFVTDGFGQRNGVVIVR
jgi:1,4-alpha-glucan branching enzyme